jgi:uncharacterized membrane protein HdeD (DUF308 family)
MATDVPADTPPGLPPNLPPIVRKEIHDLKANWGWFLALGVLLILTGLVAVGMTFLTTVVTVVTLGAFALIASGAEIASAIWSRRWEGTMLHLLTGVLYGVFGFLLVTRPLLAAEVLTLVLALLLLTNGLFRIGFAATVRFHHWGWSALSGLLSVLLGVLIWQEWPESGLWVIGLFVGIDLLMTGWTWVILALGLKGLPDPLPTANPAA